MTSLARRLPLGTMHPKVSDRIRQSSVLAATFVALSGAVVGSGLAGGRAFRPGAGGAPGPATLVAPAGPAFAIGSVVSLGLAGYAIWQALPSQAMRRRQRGVGYWLSAALLLDAAWLLAVRAGLLAVSVPVIVLLLGVLVVVFVRLQHEPGGTNADAVLLDGTVGLHLGWVMVVTVADVAAWLNAAGVTATGLDRAVWAMAALGAVAVCACVLAVWDRGRLAPALASAWGLGWIAVARVAGALPSAVVAVTALAAGILVVLVAVAVRVAHGPAGDEGET